jgi:hypothetical protein
MKRGRWMIAVGALPATLPLVLWLERGVQHAFRDLEQDRAALRGRLDG